MNDLARKADRVANLPATHDRTGTDGHVPPLQPISSPAAPAVRVLRPVRAPAPHPLRQAQALPGADVAVERQAPSLRGARAGPARPTGRARRPLRRAGFELIGLAADDAELWELVGRSRPDAGPAAATTPPWHGSGIPAAAKASLRGPEEAGILILSRRGYARYALEQLTEREREVLAAMAEGRSNSAIARQLSVTEHTVEKHIKNIFAALWLAPSSDDHRRVLAVLIYLTAVAAK